MDKRTLYKKIIIWFYDHCRERVLRKKAHKIIAASEKKISFQQTPVDVLIKYRLIWKQITGNTDSLWLNIYGNISGNWDHRYVPETLYYNYIEPSLNNKAFSKGLTDKNFYPEYLSEFKIPETLIKNIEGVYYDNRNNHVGAGEVIARLGDESRIITKPAVDSGGGKGVSFWKKENGIFSSEKGVVLNSSVLDNNYKKNFIIQKFVEQHPFYKRYNPGSLNTLRLLTYRSVTDEKIHLLHIIFRVGASGSITDNQASGGFACGINNEGSLKGIAVDKWGNRYDSVNGILLEKGTRLEGIDRIKESAVKVASKYYYSRLMGIDLCLDNNNDVRLIEVNNINNEINFYQMLNGPLFGTFTEEVIRYCTASRRSFLLDYDI